MLSLIKGLIDVKSPYFSMTSVESSGSKVTAKVTGEQPMENETGSMAAAEAGRHLAILGSCALALSNPIKKRHYYLAHKARLSRVTASSCFEQQEFHVESETTEINKRSGRAMSGLYAGGRNVFNLDVKYHVMQESVFRKLYKNKIQTYTPHTASPYAQEYELKDVEYGDTELSATLGPLSAAQCSGHFDDIPCLPVAVLMHTMSRSAGRLMSHQLNTDINYIVDSADIEADNLAFAGERVFIQVKCQKRTEDDFVYLCVASDGNGKKYGEMYLTLIAVFHP